MAETDWSLSAWGERAEDEALLSINRSLLIHLLPSPLHLASRRPLRREFGDKLAKVSP